MKGTFSSYDEKTGKGTINVERASSWEGFSALAKQQWLLDGEPYEFNVPLSLADKTYISVGNPVEFDVLSRNPRTATNLRY